MDADGPICETAAFSCTSGSDSDDSVEATTVAASKVQAIDDCVDPPPSRGPKGEPTRNVRQHLGVGAHTEWSLRCYSIAPTFAEMLDAKSIEMGRCASKKHAMSLLCGHALDWAHLSCTAQQLNQKGVQLPKKMGIVCRSKFGKRCNGVLHELLQRTPNMEVLCCEAFVPFSGPFASITPSHFHRLKSLELCDAFVGQDPREFDCKYLHECPSPNVGDLFTFVANHCPQLQLFRMKTCVDDRSLFVPAPAINLLLTKCHNLQALLMPLLESVDGLFDGVPGTNLRFLELSEEIKYPPYRSPSTDDDDDDEAAEMHGKWGQEHTARLAAGIARSCPHLQALSLRSRSLKDADVEVILRSCHEMERMDLQECYGSGMQGAFFDAVTDSGSGSGSGSDSISASQCVLVPKLRFVYLVNRHELKRSCRDLALRFAQRRPWCLVFVPEFDMHEGTSDDWHAVEWYDEVDGVANVQQWRQAVLQKQAKKAGKNKKKGHHGHDLLRGTNLECHLEMAERNHSSPDMIAGLKLAVQEEKDSAQLEFGHHFTNVLLYADVDGDDSSSDDGGAFF